MTAALQPLNIDVRQFGVAGQHIPTIQAALERGLPELAPAILKHDGHMVIAGSGPSLPAFIEEIREQRAKGMPILACNGAHDLLCEHGINPDLFVTTDPRDLRHNLRHKNADTVYLLASRAAPEVFEHLKDCKVMIWHSYGSPEEMAAFEGKKVLRIGGGSTSGLRAIAISYMLGFRNIILYGFDSCNDAQGRKRFDSGTVGLNTNVVVGGRTFTCNMAMAAQAKEFGMVTYGLFHDIHIEAKGDGLIAAILEERKKAGYRV